MHRNGTKKMMVVALLRVMLKLQRVAHLWLRVRGWRQVRRDCHNWLSPVERAGGRWLWLDEEVVVVDEWR